MTISQNFENAVTLNKALEPWLRVFQFAIELA